MGADSVTITIFVSLDRHGDERQERDDKLYEELKEKIRQLLEDPKFAPIRPCSTI